jgi:hypothetical protein
VIAFSFFVATLSNSGIRFFPVKRTPSTETFDLGDARQAAEGSPLCPGALVDKGYRLLTNLRRLGALIGGLLRRADLEPNFTPA